MSKLFANLIGTRLEKTPTGIEEVFTYEYRKPVDTDSLDEQIASLPTKLAELESRKAEIEAVK